VNTVPAAPSATSTDAVTRIIAGAVCLVLIDAVPISYELYQKLKDQPHRAADYYERRDGKLLPKSKPGPHN